MLYDAWKITPRGTVPKWLWNPPLLLGVFLLWEDNFWRGNNLVLGIIYDSFAIKCCIQNSCLTDEYTSGFRDFNLLIRKGAWASQWTDCVLLWPHGAGLWFSRGRPSTEGRTWLTGWSSRPPRANDDKLSPIGFCIAHHYVLTCTACLLR